MDPRPDSPDETDPPPNPEPRQDNPAEQIINLFGGIRPTAHKLHVPVTTVQGWKKRGAIPEARHDDIRAAAEQHGVSVDPALLAATKPPEELEGAEDRQPEAGEAPALSPAIGEAAAGETGAAPETVTRAPPEPAPDRPQPEAATEPAHQQAIGEPGDMSALAGTTRASGPEDKTDDAAASERGENGAPRRIPERPERTAEPPGRGQAPPPPASQGGGGRGGAWLAALIAILAAAAAITAPIWGPQYLPEVWPGPVPDQWVERIEDRILPLSDRTEALAEQAGSIADIRAALSADIAALESRVGSVEALVENATGVSDAGSLLARIRDVEARLDELPEDAVSEGRLEQAIGAAEGRLADAPAELIAERLGPIAERLAQLEGLPQRIDELEGQLATAELDAGALDELNQRLQGLSTTLGEAEGRLQELARLAEARRAADIEAQALSLSIGQLRQDLLAGESFGASLATVRSLIGQRPDIAERLAQIDDYADGGIPTRNELAARFPEAMAAIRGAERAEDGDDAIARALDTLEGLVRVRPAPGEVAGDDTEAVLARAEHRVGNGNIAGAVEALAALTGPAAEAAAQWVDAAQARLAAEQVLAALDAAALERLAAEAPAGSGDAEAETGNGAERGAGDDAGNGEPGGGTDALQPPDGGGAAAPADQG